MQGVLVARPVDLATLRMSKVFRVARMEAPAMPSAVNSHAARTADSTTRRVRSMVRAHRMRAVLSRTPDNELFVEDELRPTIPFVVSPSGVPHVQLAMQVRSVVL